MYPPNLKSIALTVPEIRGVAKLQTPNLEKGEAWILKYNSRQSPCSSRRKLKVNFVVCQDFGIECLAKTKPLRPRARLRTGSHTAWAAIMDSSVSRVWT